VAHALLLQVLLADADLVFAFYAGLEDAVVYGCTVQISLLPLW